MNNDYPFEQMLLSNLYSNIDPIYRNTFSKIVDSFDLQKELISFYLKRRYELISFLKKSLSDSTRDPLLSLISWLEQPSKYASYYGLYISVLLSTLTISNSVSSRYVYTDIRQRRELRSKLHPDHWKIIKVRQLVSKILPLYGNKLSIKGKERIEKRLSNIFSEFASHCVIEDDYDIVITNGQAKEVYANTCVKSCMTDNPSNALSFYDKNDIKVIKFLKKGEMVGRAILWDDIRIMYFTYNKNKNDYKINVIDNVYYIDKPYLSDIESIDIFMKKLQSKFNDKNLIFYSYINKTSWNTPIVDSQIFNLITSNKNIEKDKIINNVLMLKLVPNFAKQDSIPYLDSFINCIPISNKHSFGMILISKKQIPSVLSFDDLLDKEAFYEKKIDIDILKYTYKNFSEDKVIHNELTLEDLKLQDFLDYSSQYNLRENIKNDNTSILFEENQIVYCSNCGARIFEDDPNTYIIDGHYYCTDCVVYSDKLDEYLVKNEAIYSEEYNDFIPEDLSVKLYNGDYVLEDDAEEIKIYTLDTSGYRVRKAWILSDCDDEYIERHYDLVYSNYLKGYINVRNAVHSEWLDDYFLKNDENIIKVKPSDTEDLPYDYCPKEYAIEINGEYYYKNDDRVISDQKVIVIEF